MSSTIRDKNNANDIWLKPKNSKSRACRFYADDLSRIRLSNTVYWKVTSRTKEF